jgi:hypothetical protein
MQSLSRHPGLAPPIAAALLFATAILPVSPAAGAVYRNRNVDGKRYRATVSNSDYGTHENVEVRFQGDHAYLHFGAGGRVVLILEDEEILDPHEVPAHDPRRGITWVLDVKDLAAD